jgi:hypothetical protein
MPLQLDPDEIRLLRRFEASRDAFTRWAAVVAAIVTPCLFTLYGYSKQDYFAVTIAFLGLLLFSLWFAIGSLRNGKALAKLSQKILNEIELPRA